SSRRRHTRFKCDWSSDVCSSDLVAQRVDVLDDEHLTARVHRLVVRAVVQPAQLELAAEIVGELLAEGRGQTRVVGFGEPVQDGRSEERRVGKECRGAGAAYSERE